MIAKACCLHREEFKQFFPVNNAGLNNPLTLYGNQHDVISQPGPQIVHIRGNHWVVVFGCVTSDVIEAYDSIQPDVVPPSLRSLCSLIFSRDGIALNNSLSLVLMPMQRQRGGDDCGLFAIATQDALLRQCAVSQLIFIQSEMRSHLSTSNF